MDMELFLHYSLIPSLFIILVLSFLQRQEHQRQRDDTSYLLGNRFGIIIPLDFVGTFRNRWSYGIAFGATANKVMFLFLEGYQPLQIPQWAQGTRAASCLLGIAPGASCSQTLRGRGSLGLCGEVRDCHVLLALTSVSGLPAGPLPAHEEKPFLEVHQVQHVKQLLRRHPPQEKKKSWFQTRIYEWDPCFQFPSRMIGTTVLAFICLYLFIVIEFCMFMYVRDEMDVFEGELENYIASVNQTGALTPVILQVKELMSVSKGVWVVTILPASLTCVSYLFHILACYRKAFHNFNYFLFFYNVLLGLGACLSRLLISCVLGTWLIARIDRTIMQNGYEGADMGYSAWIGMLYVDHYHTNPVLVSFCHILIIGHREKRLQQSIRYWCQNQPTGPHISARSRMRWFLLQTLINNPRLAMLRKSRVGHGSWESTQILSTCSES
ncbi:hypothetical protein MC885_011299 [Smutsia gigantea]|nr:hypothetical protein MC885_011299 [Smutsia gigantea]